MAAKRSNRTTVGRGSETSTTTPQLGLFTPGNVALPPDGWLMRRFEHFNLLHFDGLLPHTRVEWSRRMRIAGACYPDSRRIVLSTAYHSHFPEDIDDTLKHEMIHLLIPRHDAAFKREAARLGVTVHCKEYPGLYPRTKYAYTCPGCGTIYRRAKRGVMSCGECAPSGYDERFRLVLKPKTTTRRVAARRPSRRRPQTAKLRAALHELVFG